MAKIPASPPARIGRCFKEGTEASFRRKIEAALFFKEYI